jgi:hypothetical protein
MLIPLVIGTDSQVRHACGFWKAIDALYPADRRTQQSATVANQADSISIETPLLFMAFRLQFCNGRSSIEPTGTIDETHFQNLWQ